MSTGLFFTSVLPQICFYFFLSSFLLQKTDMFLPGEQLDVFSFKI